jgi:hypothetical protein
MGSVISMTTTAVPFCYIELLSTEDSCCHRSACTATLAQRDLTLLAAFQCLHRTRLHDSRNAMHCA